MAGKTKEFSAFVPVEEYEEFKKNFPQYGSTQWLIVGAIKSVNRLVRERPELKDVVGFSIEELLNENKRKKDDAESASTSIG